MIGALAQKIFGSANERRIRSYRAQVDAINAMERELEALSDEALRGRTDAFKAQLADGKALDDILVPAFATVREASKRTLGQRHFDVQLIGGMVLHEGKIAEMKTGEGKTLVATLPVYLNALAGRGVHVVTVNDYLARRDAEWMGEIYKFLGLSVGVIVHGLDDDERRKAYDCDVTYGTNNELGFDYLRDNMKYRLEDMVQRGHVYAIVDEVDSILVDEARTPLIISGPLEDRSEFYKTIDTFIPHLAKDDFEIDEKQRTVTLTEKGMEHMEQMLQEKGHLKSHSLYDIENVSVVHHVNQALRAHKLFHRDKDYIVRNRVDEVTGRAMPGRREVVIIDEFTGRMMPGRRYSEGLHQALEAKELSKEDIQPENQTLASITFQNYFRMYEKLAGMTGTAATEADEFQDIYNLEVLEIPTNMPMIRVDEDDEVYRTATEKFRAILVLIEDCKQRGQPVLVGTTSIEKSEQLAEMLRKQRWEQHDVSDPDAFAALYSGKQTKVFAILNARYHEQEAKIIAQAGVPGAITIATNMAGRGTDIQLGGNARFRIRDLGIRVRDAVRELVRAGGGAEREPDANDPILKWMDEHTLGIEKSIEARVEEWKKRQETRDGAEQAGKLSNAEIAAKRAEFADELAAGEAEELSRFERADGEDAAFVQWLAEQLRDRPPELWDDRENLSSAVGEVSDRLRSLGHRALTSWARAEVKAGRRPPAGEIGSKLHEIEQTLRRFKAESAQIEAEHMRLRLKALEAGGLYVLGTERHESRRIDNQLRGRSARQGDPGHSKFFLSLEDDLMRIFGSNKLDGMLQRLGLKEDEAIVHPWINKALEKAQQKVEARNFDIRKNLLKFDNVMNDQRKVIFEQRIELMRDENVAETVADMRHAVIDDFVRKHVPANAYPEQWDTAGLKEELTRVLGLDLPVEEWAKEEGIADEELLSRIERRADEHMATKVAKWGPDVIRYVEKSILLQSLDLLWREHLVTLEHLRQVIGFRGYGQRDPLNEYKAEAFSLFESMVAHLREAVTGQLMRVELVAEPPAQEQPPPLPYMEAHHVDPRTGDDELAFAEATVVPAIAGGTAPASTARRDPRNPSGWGKVGRNEPCPCGSGKKFKHCHGRYQ